MSLYENIICPVCKREFQEGDSIVTCPECGTPHHKQCYDLIGRCVNSGLHKSGYDFAADEANKPAVTEAEQSTDDSTAPSDTAEAQQAQELNSAMLVPNIDASYENDEEKIDGESVADYAAVIKTNISSFITKFKRLERSGKSLSWNWGAFLFGSLYMLFRKMYKQGFAFFCLFISGIYVSNMFLYKYAPVFVDNMNNLIASGSKSITPEQMEAVMSSSDVGAATKVTYIFLLVLFVVRIIEALVTDRMYKNNISAIIKKVREQLDNGATFMQAPFMDGQVETLSQTQMRRMYLARRGGVSPFAPLTALLIISFFL